MKTINFKNLIYNHYCNEFVKENNKDEKDIDWNKWSRLNKMCEKYYN
jgi:hypothetical protein